MTKRPRWPRAAPDSEASGPCRTVPGTIMATSRDTFQTYSTGRLRRLHNLERSRANPADCRESPGEVQGANPRTDASNARCQSTAAHRALGAIPGRMARLLRFLPDAHRAAESGRLDSSPIAHVYLATVEERADSVCATAPPGYVPLPRGRRCRGRVRALAHGSPCGSATGSVQCILRLDRPSSLGGTANRLTRSNRSGTDPYARWCGRGEAARLPPIPIIARNHAAATTNAAAGPGARRRNSRQESLRKRPVEYVWNLLSAHLPGIILEFLPLC